jgi:streptogrisin C
VHTYPGCARQSAVTGKGKQRQPLLFALLASFLTSLFALAGAAHGASLVASPLTMPVDPTLTAVMARGEHVTTAQAEQRIQTQANGANLNLQLETQLGSKYAGLWYNSATGRLAIGVADSAAHDTIDSVAKESVAAGEVETVPVHSTWADLVDAQNLINSRLAALFSAEKVTTGLYTPTNAVVVNVSSAASAADKGAVAAVAQAFPGVTVEVHTKPANDFHISARTCHWGALWVHCDQPLRGADEIEPFTATELCSAGLLAKQGGTYYMMTAGHCIYFGGGSGVRWRAWSSNGAAHTIGEAGGYVWGQQHPNPGGTRDSGAIAIESSSYWHTNLNAYAFGAPAASELYPTVGVAEPYVGLSLCHLGIATENDGSGSNCGHVLELHSSLTEGGDQVNDMTRASDCAHAGDSGGPYYANNIAYGTESGGPTCPWHGGWDSGESYFDNAGTIQYENGVTICRLSVC